MPDNVSISIAGMDQVTSNLTAVANMLGWQTSGNALRAEAEIEMTEAKKRTPVQTGALRGSGHVTGPDQVGADIVVKLAFGNASVDYAVKVHENLEAFHRVGQAKFLESVILESAAYLAQRVANRIQRGLGAGFAPGRSQLSSRNEDLNDLNTSLDE